ncbi:hypothetical protein HAX54_023077 [Datura stramonium]|uniref:Uncharacterized protein n=1 Tax=Datura stramonium TaxID=4076 RepID=A0ABS8UY43_DATST|nr:hypothetical protein [Datura stramonium]
MLAMKVRRSREDEEEITRRTSAPRWMTVEGVYASSGEIVGLVNQEQDQGEYSNPAALIHPYPSKEGNMNDFRVSARNCTKRCGEGGKMHESPESNPKIAE